MRAGERARTDAAIRQARNPYRRIGRDGDPRRPRATRGHCHPRQARHAGVEELHLLYGELLIDDKKLCPGDFIRAEAGSEDHRVWSETGCTCVLITSPSDILR